MSSNKEAVTEMAKDLKAVDVGTKHVKEKFTKCGGKISN
ncbi:hypothetical protein UABAM_02836 [Candidatus Uabimicrobium amorphum]|uniref:Uncharacterized protein n=1 Tax=Uabimicrobium amorphum TaxID=2596890 RepID=A0A5S9IPU4_UABAM|nr:hypothetical protein UABAM_02836 [Candidatus Uabimicrobium amorphum]